MFQIHIKIKDSVTLKEEYKPVRPTGGPPYEYKTRKEAQDMALICYREHWHLIKIVEVKQ